jgi:hypothetical protein
MLDAIGGADQATADLVAEVRKQFFVKTASRPYIDRLAANSKISRPRLVGMSDTSFRDYIPVLSYKPKQVKLIIDALLDIFFFKESTTAFIMSSATQPFSLLDGWELEYVVDNIYQEKITFSASDFTNIASATADEIVASFNRQAKYSYATNYYDSITKKNFIRIFTTTVGSKGSLEMTGGRANIGLRLNGFIETAGTGSNTQWTVSKIGDVTTFEHTGGASPGINKLQEGDIIVSDLLNNKGSFVITNVDISGNKITFKNLFSTPGVFIQLSSNETKFIRPEKFVSYKSSRRAITWETSPGEIIVEMPTTPPVVQRSLKGSSHLNGAFSLMTNRDSDTSLTLTSGNGFPKAGSFWIEPVTAITSRIITPDVNEVVTKTQNGRLIYDLVKYDYSSRVVLSTTGSAPAGSDQITVLSVTGLSIGDTIFIDGLREDAVVTNIVGLTVTSSILMPNNFSNVTVEFGGNTLLGIDPALPPLGTLNEFTLSSLTRTSGIVTATTSTAHNYAEGDTVIVDGSSGILILTTSGDITASSIIVSNMASTVGVAPGQVIAGPGIVVGTKVASVISPTSISLTAPATATQIGALITVSEDLNGSHIIQSVTTSTFTYEILGVDGTAITAGTSRVERSAISNEGSKIILTDAQSSADTRITGSYVWDTAAPYVLSYATANTGTQIQAGTIVRLIDVSSNEIPNESGFLVFDYGRKNQEGPIRYLYKPSDTTIALDPSYVFQKNHIIGSPVVALRQKGPHVMDTRAGEYGPYITDPSEARIILQDLIRSVKSAGIFVNFLIRFPEQLYGTIDVYGSGIDPG